MRTVVGTMTGTSMDSVDAVAVSIQGQGKTMTASFGAIASQGLGDLPKILRHLASGNGSTNEMNHAAAEIGSITASAISKLDVETIDLIALHGQTIFHKPPTSIQLIDPTPVVDTFQCTVLTDPRKADLDHGGQGAPITPLADWVMFRSKEESTAIVNLGGFCNVTVLPAGSEPNAVQGFDVCCCNLILDAIARQLLGEAFDCGGKEAMHGSPDKDACSQLLEHLEQQRTARRSLGTGDDLGDYTIKLGLQLSPADLLATATVAIGSCITNAVHNVDRVFLSGGGVHNAALRNAIRNDGTTDDLGIPTQAREAMAMAILGALAQDGVSITLPQITGRRETSELVGWVQARP